MEQHHGTGGELISFSRNYEAGERGSISVTGIVVFFTLILLLVIGSNWVDNDLALGAFRAVVSQAAQAGALEGAAGGPLDACYAEALQAQANLISGSLAKNIAITCTLQQLPSGTQIIVATADGALSNWDVLVTSHVHVVAQAPVEVNPAQPSVVDP